MYAMIDLPNIALRCCRCLNPQIATNIISKSTMEPSTAPSIIYSMSISPETAAFLTYDSSSEGILCTTAGLTVVITGASTAG